ncbi:MAG: SPOR domain-containing protein [Flavobacterium sp.]|nr:SPOR domain-containing protein [Flavobacterium sp.]
MTACSFGQGVFVNQDPKFEQLLNEKRKVNSSIYVSGCYKIQIFNGTSDESKKALVEFKKENKNQDATIVFSTPYYKVWVGNYKTRIEAEKNVLLLRKKYPNSILIKPSL